MLKLGLVPWIALATFAGAVILFGEATIYQADGTVVRVKVRRPGQPSEPDRQPEWPRSGPLRREE